MITLTGQSTTNTNFQTPTVYNRPSCIIPNKRQLSTVNYDTTTSISDWTVFSSKFNRDSLFPRVKARFGLLLLICIILCFSSTTTFAAEKPRNPKASALLTSMPQVDTVTVWSQSMHKPIKNVVILPATYNQQDTTRHWPVVYLLHGFRGRYDTWINKTQPALPEAASRMGEIIVCPDGGFSSWYWDSPIDSTMRYETYITQELIPAIDSLYQTRPSRKGRAITGYSMGGHGALYLALRHPSLFGACGSMSGGVALAPFPKTGILKNESVPASKTHNAGKSTLSWDNSGVPSPLMIEAVKWQDYPRSIPHRNYKPDSWPYSSTVEPRTISTT